jgi:hypothetical protein
MIIRLFLRSFKKIENNYFIRKPFADGRVDDIGGKMANYKQKLNSEMIKMIISQTNQLSQMQ